MLRRPSVATQNRSRLLCIVGGICTWFLSPPTIVNCYSTCRQCGLAAYNLSRFINNCLDKGLRGHSCFHHGVKCMGFVTCTFTLSFNLPLSSPQSYQRLCLTKDISECECQLDFLQVIYAYIEIEIGVDNDKGIDI